MHCERCILISYKDMLILCQGHGVTSAVMVTMEIQQEGLDRFGCVSPVTVIKMLILMLLEIATGPRASA